MLPAPQLADAAGNSALHQVVLSWQGERAEAFLAIVQELLIAGEAGTAHGTASL